MNVRIQAMAITFDGDDTFDQNREELLMTYTWSQDTDIFAHIDAIASYEAEVALHEDTIDDTSDIDAVHGYRDEITWLGDAA
jgi:hypothetical protein